MAHTSIENNHDVVKSLWIQGHRNAREISKKSGVALRSCERYVAQLKKNGQIPKIRRPGRPRKISPDMRRQLGRLVNANHFTTAGEMKARLEETHLGFQVGEQTVRD